HQIGDPVSIYRQPVSSFVADFIGSTNLFECIVDTLESDGFVGLTTVAGTQLRVTPFPSAAKGAACHAAIRPELVIIRNNGIGDGFDAVITGITFVGNFFTVACTLDNGEVVIAETPSGRKDLLVGQRVKIGWNPADVSVFP